MRTRTYCWVRTMLDVSGASDAASQINAYRHYEILLVNNDPDECERMRDEVHQLGKRTRGDIHSVLPNEFATRS